MPLMTVTEDDVLKALTDVGVESGDTIYVASSLTVLGYSRTIVDDCINALLEAVGPNGTVLVPTFNFGFCHGESYDPATTPSKTGVLTEAFRKRPGARRTIHPPFHSVAVIGKQADLIAGIRSPSSFGKESVFHWLYKQDAKCVLLGCSYRDGAVHFHWLEELFQVPYRYWKQFRGLVKTEVGFEENAYYMFARRLDIDSDWSGNVNTLGAEFENSGFVREAKIGYGRVKSFTLSDFYNFMAPKIQADKLILVKDEVKSSYRPAYTPVLRFHHIGIAPQPSRDLESFMEEIGYHIAFEGLMPEFNIDTQIYSGFNVSIELLKPIDATRVAGDNLAISHGQPLHHIAFQVDDFELARDFFEHRGYSALDDQVHMTSVRDQYSYFLSPAKLGGVIIELVFTRPTL